MDSIFRLFTLKDNVKLNDASDINESLIYDIGTGFFVNENGFFVTAGHVVKDYKNKNIIAVYNNKIYNVKIIKINYPEDGMHKGRINDYAFGKLNVGNNITEPFPISRNTQLVKGKKLNIIGFTGELNEKDKEYDSVFSAYALINIPSFFYADGNNIVTKIYKGIKLGEYVENAFQITYEKKLKKNPAGMSGGAILNMSNEVVGIFVSGNQRIGTCIIMDDALNDIKKFTC